MINELFMLGEILDREGIETKSWHRKYLEIPRVSKKAPLYRVWLRDNGEVGRIDVNEEMEDAKNVVRKYQPSENGVSFPAFNIKALYRVTKDEEKIFFKVFENGKAKAGISDIEKICKEENKNWVGGESSFERKSLLISQKIETDKLSDVFKRLSNIIANYGDSPEQQFFYSMKKYIISSLNRGEKKELLKLLIYSGGDKKYSIVLDVLDCTEEPIVSAKSTACLNGWLLANEKFKEEKASPQTQCDAFGMPYNNVGAKMPQVKLPRFTVTLRSMAKAKQCQYRYGCIEEGSYPISEENRKKAKRALEYIMSDDNRGYTWQEIDNDEFVCVYPSYIPKIKLPIAGLFRNLSESQMNTQNFTDIARELIKAFSGIPAAEQPDGLRIFGLCHVDKARTKVSFSYDVTPQSLISNAESWKLGCCNLPESFIENNDILFPLEISDAINTVWKQDGSKAGNVGKVHKFKRYQGIELLLDIFSCQEITNFLHLLVRNTVGLIKNVRGSRNSKDDKEANMAITVMALLLYKLKERREDYMEKLAYSIGRLLRLSDELHALYCREKRNGDYPAQLVGNSLFVAAGDMPVQTMEQLGRRIMPYVAWAKQTCLKREPGYRLIGYYLGLYQEIMNKIENVWEGKKIVRLNDAEKAELFIGYMASLPKKNNRADGENNDDFEGGK